MRITVVYFIICLFLHKSGQKSLTVQENSFSLSKDSMTWTSANAFCTTLNSSLLIVKGDEDLSRIWKLLNSVNISSVWTRAHRNKIWVWQDGTEVKHFDWGKGEPNNLKAEEDRIQLLMTHNYKWNDGADAEKFTHLDTGGVVNKYICEYNNKPCDRQSDDPCYELEGRSFVFKGIKRHEDHDGRCVGWNEKNTNHIDPNYWKNIYCPEHGISWSAANKTCSEVGGSLAKLDTPEKIRDITEFIIRKTSGDKKYHGNYWIGAKFTTRYGEWTWGDNKIAEEIKISETGEVQSNQLCGALMNEQLQSENCETKYFAMCSATSDLKTTMFNNDGMTKATTETVTALNSTPEQTTTVTISQTTSPTTNFQSTPARTSTITGTAEPRTEYTNKTIIRVDSMKSVAAVSRQQTGGFPNHWWYAAGAAGLVLLLMIVFLVVVFGRRRKQLPKHLVAVSNPLAEFTTSENPLFGVSDPSTLPVNTSIKSYKGRLPFRSYKPDIPKSFSNLAREEPPENIYSEPMFENEYLCPSARRTLPLPPASGSEVLY